MEALNAIPDVAGLQIVASSATLTPNADSTIAAKGRYFFLDNFGSGFLQSHSFIFH